MRRSEAPQKKILDSESLPELIHTASCVVISGWMGSELLSPVSLGAKVVITRQVSPGLVLPSGF